MNRIRKINNKYQVLITPHTHNSSSFETLFDMWLDDCFGNFSVIDFHNLQDAQCEAFRHPDIDWYKIYLSHIELHKKYTTLLTDIISDHNFVVEFEDHLMQPNDIKNSMFDRVFTMGDNFSLKYAMDDIIGFHVVNPWTSNLELMAKIFKLDHRLNIVRTHVDHKMICLTGRTDIGTTYQIKLWPSQLFNWAKWTDAHRGNPQISGQSAHFFNKAIRLQETIDGEFCLR